MVGKEYAQCVYFPSTNFWISVHALFLSFSLLSEHRRTEMDWIICVSRHQDIGEARVSRIRRNLNKEEGAGGEGKGRGRGGGGKWGRRGRGEADVSKGEKRNQGEDWLTFARCDSYRKAVCHCVKSATDLRTSATRNTRSSREEFNMKEVKVKTDLHNYFKRGWKGSV